MADDAIVAEIERLLAEEKELRESGRGLSADQRQRIDRLEVELDQCWDLLRQRRAAREFDENPDETGVRDPETVETYEQ